MRYFTNIQTAEELKKQFRTLCQTMHPDKGGNAQEFAEMLNEYESALKNAGAWTKAEREQVAGMRRGTLVIFYGAGMTRTNYVITSINGEDIKLLRLFSGDFKSLEDVEYYDKESDRTSRHTCGRYSHIRPISKKFGIGFYWDDLDGKTYTDEEIKEAERVADNFDKWIKIKEEKEAEEERKAQEEADRAEAAIIAQWAKVLEVLPPRYQMKRGAEWNALTREERKAEEKAERKANASRLAAFKRNVKAMFNHYFPGVKVSVTNSSKCWSESSVISWVDGPTVAEVEAVEAFDHFRASSWCSASPYEDYGHSETRRTLAKFRAMYGAFSDDKIKFERTFSEETEKAVTAAIVELIPDYEGKQYNDKIQTEDAQAEQVIKFFGFDFSERWSKEMTEEENKQFYKREREHKDERESIRRIIAPSFQRWANECYWQSIHELFVKYYRIAKVETAKERKTATTSAKAETVAENGGKPAEGLQLVEIAEGVAVVGDTRTTYKNRKQIKAHGATWNKAAQRWEATTPEAVESLRKWFGLDEEPQTAEEVPTIDAESVAALAATVADIMQTATEGDTLQDAEEISEGATIRESVISFAPEDCPDLEELRDTTEAPRGATVEPKTAEAVDYTLYSYTMDESAAHCATVGSAEKLAEYLGNCANGRALDLDVCDIYEATDKYIIYYCSRCGGNYVALFVADWHDFHPTLNDMQKSQDGDTFREIVRKLKAFKLQREKQQEAA